MDRRTAAAYLPLVAIWGCSFLFINLALRALDPVQVAFGRVLLGAITLLIAARLQGGLQRPRRSELPDLVVVAATLAALPFALIAMAEQRITSILAGLLNATTPLFTVLVLSVLLPAERPNRRQLVGIGLGFVGIAVLVGAWRVDEVDLPGVALMLTATFCYGVGAVWTRLRMRGSSLSGTNISLAQVVIASIMLLPFAVAAGAPRGGVGAAPWIGLALLGAGGTGLGFVLFWRLLRESGPTLAATVTYALPLVSTTVGVLVLGEQVSWNEPVGGAIVIAGVALVHANARRNDPAPTAAPAATPRAE